MKEGKRREEGRKGEMKEERKGEERMKKGKKLEELIWKLKMSPLLRRFNPCLTSSGDEAWNLHEGGKNVTEISI